MDYYLIALFDGDRELKDLGREPCRFWFVNGLNLSNQQPITWPTVKADTHVTGFQIFDSEGGACCELSELTEPFDVPKDWAPEFSVGQIWIDVRP